MKTKFTVIFVLFIFMTMPNFAQSPFQIHDLLPSYIKNYTSIDNISYIITYDVARFRFPKNATMVDAMTGTKIDYKEAKADSSYLSKDIQILEIGNGISKTYSNIVYVADSSVAYLLSKGAKGYPSKYGLSLMTIEPIEVYKNYPLGKYTITRRAFGKEVLLYEEPYPIDFKWQLKDDKKTIHSYECQKATTTFRGRTYEAWFAMDIPISDGPYKFGGLPGLILELRDSDNEHVYNCIGIKECKTVMPIKFWDWKYTRTTKEKYNKRVKSMHDNFGMHYIALYPKNKLSAYNSDGSYDKRLSEGTRSRKLHYNPIELE